MSLDICMLPGWAAKHVALRGPTAALRWGLRLVLSVHIYRGQKAVLMRRTSAIVKYIVFKTFKQAFALRLSPTVMPANDERRGRNEKDVWKEAVDSALTSLDNQSPGLDAYKKRVNKWRQSSVIGFDFFFQSKSSIIVPASLNMTLMTASGMKAICIDEAG